MASAMFQATFKILDRASNKDVRISSIHPVFVYVFLFSDCLTQKHLNMRMYPLIVSSESTAEYFGHYYSVFMTTKRILHWG